MHTCLGGRGVGWGHDRARVQGVCVGWCRLALYYDVVERPLVKTAHDRENSMEYRRFERLVIGSAAVLVALTLAVSAASGGVDAAEFIGQLAVVGVVASAVHWGRKVGTFAALAACLLYLALRLPMLANEPSMEVFLLVVTRFAGYCIIGIVGGELFARVKYLFASSTESNVIDDWSRVYNQRYLAKALERALERHTRYQEPFSIIILGLAPSITASRRP